MSPGVSPAPPSWGWGKSLANRERAKGFWGLRRGGFSPDVQEVGVYCLSVKEEVVGMLGACNLSLGTNVHCGRKDQKASRLLTFFLL